jgi:hypothetical protein
LKIQSPGYYAAANQPELLNELNLKEGQRIIGRIVSLNNDEAVLDLAGRSIHAKVEGFLPPIGTTQTFSVALDEQGRTILRVQLNPQENNSGNDNLKASPAVENTALQKSIINALNQEGLPATNENIQKITQYIQDFQAKYQQSISAKVFTFIMARKWPVDPATILTSLVFQEPEARDQLWEKLRKTLTEQNTNQTLLSQLNLKKQSNVPEIAAKLKLLTGLNIANAKRSIAAADFKTQADIAAKKEPSGADSSDDKTQREKIESILEQNIAVNKSILKETTVSGHFNVIPLLVIDTQSNIRECMVQWKEEKSGANNINSIQTLYMTIPTDNLGDIDLVLRSDSKGTRINLQVNSDAIRRYLTENASELKTMIAGDNTTISIDLKDKIENLAAPGVDLWM